MPGRDQRDVVTIDQLEQPRTRFGLDGPITGVTLVPIFNEQRPMREPRDLALTGRRELLTQPFQLTRLFVAVAAEEHRIDPDQTPILEIARPPVITEMAAPAREALRVYRLMRIAGLADIVIAWDGDKRRAKRAHQFRALLHIFLVVGAVHRKVAGMDDQIGVLPQYPVAQRRPVRREMRLRAAEMRIGNLQDARHVKRLGSMVSNGRRCAATAIFDGNI